MVPIQGVGSDVPPGNEAPGHFSPPREFKVSTGVRRWAIPVSEGTEEMCGKQFN